MPNDTGAQHDHYVTTFSAQGTEIDIFSADIIWPAEFAQANYALELDRFIERDGVDLNTFFPGTVEAVTFKNRVWALPMLTDAGLLYYRKDIVEHPPSTWDELIALAQAHQGQEETEFGYVMQANQYEGLICNAIEFIESYGGKVIDEDGKVVVNSPETIKGIEKMIEIANSFIVPSDIFSFKETETENAFIEGKAVFARNWTYMQSMAANPEGSKVVDKVGFALLPAGDAGSAATLGGWVTMINRYSKHPEEAWEFVKFVSSPEGQKISALIGGLAPTLPELYEDEEVKSVATLFANEEFVATLQNAVPRPVTPIYPRISDIMQIELSRALAGRISAEEATKNMQEKMENALAE